MQSMQTITAVFFLFVLCSCSSESKKDINTSEVTAERERWRELEKQLENRLNTRYVTLLAIKYNLQAPQVEGIIDSYFARFHVEPLDTTKLARLVAFTESRRKLVNANQVTLEFVNRVNEVGKIPQQTVASIIMEYRLLTNDCDKYCSYKEDLAAMEDEAYNSSYDDREN